MKTLLFLFVVFITGISSGYAQIDSLLNALQKQPSDSAKIKICYSLSEYYGASFPDSGVYFANKGLQLSRQMKSDYYAGKFLMELGWNYYANGRFDSSEVNYFRAISIFENLKDTLNLCYAYGNIASLYKDQGKFALALQSSFKSLHIAEVLNNPLVTAGNLNGIGLIYTEEGKYDKALSCLNRAVKINKKLKKDIGLSNNYGNIAVIYLWKKEFKKAIYYSQLSIKHATKQDYNVGIANAHSNIAIAYHDLYNQVPVIDSNKHLRDSLLNQTFYHSQIAVSIAEDMQDLHSISSYKSNMAEYLQSKAKITANPAAKAQLLKQAEEQLLEGLSMDSLNKTIDGFRYKFASLYNLYKDRGDYKKALSAYENHIIFRDSIFNDENTKRILEQELNYKYEKQAATDSIKRIEEKKLNDAIVKQEQTKRYALYGGLILLLAFLGFVYNRFRLSKQQNKIIQQQRELVEEKNKEITDSINYAKRIQDAYLPPVEVLKHYFNNSFLLFQPKDIVSGDFYWFYSPKDESHCVYVAVADCTGHGVPGAIMSVICCNALNEAVITMKLREPGKILDEVRRIVIQNLKSSREGKQKDGMDISLIAVNTLNQHLQFAGANNPLWILKKDDQSITEVKGDKQPVGMYDQLSPFITHQMQLRKDDQLFLFSDGFADQFGGDKGKKFKYANLKQLLLDNRSYLPEVQMNNYQRAFETWRGDLEQVDDVCLIGIKL